MPSRFLRRPTQTTVTTRGQSLVEFALVAPVLLLIVLFAVDFGRLYMGWITINGMARIGANYAAQHPHAWTTPGDPAARAEYLSLMSASQGALNCALVAPPAPSFPEGRSVGKPAMVNIDCNFRLSAPLISMVTGNPVRVSASTTFPIAYGCGAGCPPPPPLETPPPPVDNCRTVPTMSGLSLLGARHSWVAAGFLDSKVTVPPASVPTDTVAAAALTAPPGGDFCPAGKMFFSTAVTFAVTTPEPVVPPCLTLPNVKGMAVAEARAAWVATEFTGMFTPDAGSDASIVVSQNATPAAAPGACVDPGTELAVVYGAPPPPPPPAPCKVPSLVNTSTASAGSTWTSSGFVVTNLTFRGSTPYTIKTQTLVGGTWVACQSTMQVAKN